MPEPHQDISKRDTSRPLHLTQLQGIADLVSRQPYIVVLALLTVVYIALADVCLRLASYFDGIGSPVWLPTGMAVAVLVLWGVRYWPIVLIGNFVVIAHDPNTKSSPRRSGIAVRSPPTRTDPPDTGGVAETDPTALAADDPDIPDGSDVFIAVLPPLARSACSGSPRVVSVAGEIEPPAARVSVASPEQPERTNNPLTAEAETTAA